MTTQPRLFTNAFLATEHPMAIDTRHVEMYRISCVRTAAGFTELRSAWNRLSNGIPFRRWEWCEAWWRHYAQPDWRLHLIVVVDDTQAVVGIAPLYERNTWSHGRVLSFLGSSEVCGDFLSLLCVPGLERPVAQRMAAYLCAAAGGSWDLLQLTGVTGQDVACRWLIQAARGRGCPVDQIVISNTWRTTLNPNWEQFVATLSKHARRKVRTLKRRLVDTGRVRVHDVTTVDELPAALQMLHDLHQRRRNSLGEAGCFKSARFRAFHAEVATQFLQSGILRLRWLELDGEPLAIEYGFVDGETVYLYQSGFAPERAAENPGWLQILISLKFAAEAGYLAFDFLRGDEPYKAAWGAQPTALVELRVVNRHWPARLRYLAWRAGRGLKALVRQRILLALPAVPLGEV